MKKAIRFISAIILALTLSSCGVSRLKDISVNSFRIEQVSPRGLRGIDVLAVAEIDNPAMDIAIDSLKGKIFRLSDEIGTLDAEPVFIQGKSAAPCHIRARLSLSRNISLFEVLDYASRFDAGDYTIDARAYVRLGKKKKANLMEIKGAPLNDLISLVDGIQPDHTQNK